MLVRSEAKSFRDVPVAKASLNRAIKLRAADVKPGDLPMSRMKRQ